MKYLIILLLVGASFTAQAQTADGEMTAGDHLLNARSLHFTGLALSVGSAALMSWGAYEQNTDIMIVGGLGAIAGIGASIASWIHIGNAGREMNKISLNKKHGVGIAWRL